MTTKPPLPECSALGRYAAAPMDKPQRPRGRPKTRTSEHYAALHAELSGNAVASASLAMAIRPMTDVETMRSGRWPSLISSTRMSWC